MSWLVFALAGPVLWAISVHLDKYLVERFFKDSDVAVLLVFTASVGLLFLPFIWFYEPNVTAPGAASIAVIMASGVLYMGAMLLYLRALQTEEASVVAPFFQTSPLFGYGLAYLVLGETLSGRQMIGGVLIITGALIVSLLALLAPLAAVAVAVLFCWVAVRLLRRLFRKERPADSSAADSS